MADFPSIRRFWQLREPRPSLGLNNTIPHVAIFVRPIANQPLASNTSSGASTQRTSANPYGNATPARVTPPRIETIRPPRDWIPPPPPKYNGPGLQYGPKTGPTRNKRPTLTKQQELMKARCRIKPGLRILTLINQAHTHKTPRDVRKYVRRLKKERAARKKNRKHPKNGNQMGFLRTAISLFSSLTRNKPVFPGSSSAPQNLPPNTLSVEEEDADRNAANDADNDTNSDAESDAGSGADGDDDSYIIVDSEDIAADMDVLDWDYFPTEAEMRAYL
ncbi:MAG: hypothetical protein M1829_000494 [Trizodia sp. TS-e1964]|nr:MAG: hypothetical protein M1829_000494 [Trizodia sp. TS-e1964]